jgi:surface polysaccharide O-acyltransferase-like enzyme
LAYFSLGLVLGTGQRWQKIGWPKLWAGWLVLGIGSFLVYMILMGEMIQLPGLASQALLGTTFAVSCAGLSLGLLGGFRKFVHEHHALLDSLSVHSYSIYIIHYTVIIWIQFLLLSVPWPAWAKFSVTFAGGLALSWGASKLIHQIPIIRRIL